MVYIKRVWGHADNQEINLTKIDNTDEWQAFLPPDLVDGWYATILYAEASNGKIGTWHGILYVANGISHLHIQEENFTWWLLPQTSLKLILRQTDRFGYELLPNREITFEAQPPRCELILQEECEYHGS